MLQDIRANSQGTIAKIIIGLIVISFSIFGIESLLFSGNTNAVADVDGTEISAFELQQEVAVQQRQLLAILGDNADPALLDQARLSNQALETLVQRTVLKQAAEAMGLAAADATIADMIGSMEQFQIDGQFSRDMFQSALASAGFTPSLFRERLAEDIQVGQFRAGFAGSDFVTPAELELAAAITAEGRDVRYISLPLDRFLADVEVTDEEIAAYYEQNSDAFMTQETLNLEYAELLLEDFVQPISPERLREEFELVRDQYDVPTETRVSHILLEGPESERDQRAAEVLAALDGGMSFEDAAREYSDDIGSSGFGGDLGYTAGDTFPEAMESALAGLAVGEISGPVETDAGTHILRVSERREGSAVRFEDVATELEQQLQRDEAAAELLRQVERLSDLVFNAADLDEPTADLGLELQRAEGVTRNANEGPLASPALLQAAFSSDVLELGHNSEVIEVSPERFVVLRVADRVAPRVRDLEEVSAEIADTLRVDAARRAAQEQAAELLAALESGTSVEEAANAAGLEWQVELGARRNSPRLPPAVREELFAMAEPETDQPRRAIVEGSGDASYLMEFSRVIPGGVDRLAPEEQRQLAMQLAGESGGLVQQQLEATLRENADVTVF